MKKIVLIIVITLFFGASICLFNVKKSITNHSLLSNDFIIIAHRGASGYAPEHTMEAYKLAVEMGADYIEIDLRMTSDGILVVMHDESVNRTTNGKGLVSSQSIKNLKELDAGTWFNEAFPDKAKNYYVGLKIPTLE